ncbi:hypothetical protein [Haloferax sp. YSMS24]|uniref:hypothetical protein n=1 Tax=unclassified Haloferax TaxID=2625095 RepID=UPI00398D0AB7
MAQTGLFIGFVVGVVLLALVAALTSRGGQRYSVENVGREGDTKSRVAAWSDDPTVLSLVFLLAALGFGLVAVVFMGYGGLSQEMTNVAGAALVVATLVVVVSYLFYGSYYAARSRGLARSQAVLLGSWVLGMLFVASVTLRLLGVL